MKLNITRNEYRLLLDLAYLGEWIMDSYDEEEMDASPYRLLIQKIYSYAAEMGYPELVEADEESNAYFPTKSYEDESQVFEIISNYDDLSFWQELEQRLVERDLRNELGEAEYSRLANQGLSRAAEPYYRKYAKELHEHGIERFQIMKDAPST